MTSLFHFLCLEINYVNCRVVHCSRTIALPLCQTTTMDYGCIFPCDKSYHFYCTSVCLFVASRNLAGWFISAGWSVSCVCLCMCFLLVSSRPTAYMYRDN